MQKSRHAPNDSDKATYWVLDDQSLTITNAYELESVLQTRSEIDESGLEQLTASGGAFSATGDIQLGGMHSSDVAAVADNLLVGSTDPSPRDSKAEAKAAAAAAKAEAAAAKLAAAAAAKAGGAGGPGSVIVSAETPLTEAKRKHKQLVRFAGEARQYALRLEATQADPSLVASLNDIQGVMEQQFTAMVPFLKDAPCEENLKSLDAMNKNIDQILKYYDEKKQFAVAFCGAAQRLSGEPKAKSKAKPKQS